MLERFRSFIFPPAAAKPSPPVPFGFKTGWIAVRATDPKAVAAALPTRSQTNAGWSDGIDAAYEGDSVFITPPVYGWICIVGAWALGGGERGSVESIAKTVTELSSQFEEAHGYATHRVVDYHHWIMAKEGGLIRCYAYIGESGETLCQIGAVTDVEKKLKLTTLPPGQQFPDEEDVMAVASSWSFDPSKLSEASGPAAAGILARLQ